MVGFSMRAYQAKLKAQLIKEGKIPRTRAPNKKKQLSPGSQHLINYLSIVKPKKTKKQLKEEENLRLELYFNEKKQEEAANATASNTQASSGDSDQTAAGSYTAPVNSNTETMAMIDTEDVIELDCSPQIFDNEPPMNNFSDAIPWEEPNTDSVVPVHLISYVHGQEEQEWEEQVKKDSEKRKRQKEQLSQDRKQSAALHLAWWDKLEPQVYEAYETFVSQSEEGSSKPPPGCFSFECECECSPQCSGDEIHLICISKSKTYRMCKKIDWSVKILENGFCPADKTLKISFSFHCLEFYSLLQVESQVACYAYASVRKSLVYF
jgi:hypothetical protein